MAEGIDSKYELDISGALASLDRLHDAFGKLEKRMDGAERKTVFTKATAESARFNQSLGQSVQVTRQVEASAKAYKSELGKLENIYSVIQKKQREYAAAGQYDTLLRDLDKVKKRLKEIEGDTDKISRKKPGDAGGGGASGIGSLATKLGALSIAGIGAAEVGRMIVTEWAAFGKKLSEVSAITGLTGKDLQFLSDSAMELESTSGIAGTEILEAFKNIGSIKPEILASKEALADTTKEVIALAQASGLSLPEAAKAVIGALNQFGEAADQTARFVNVLAAGALKGSSEVNDTAEALQNSGTAMKAAGVSFEQGNALLQILAKGMIKGSEAGTALRNMLLKLETSADKNLRPSVVGLDKALDAAAKKFNTTAEQTKMFGLENIVAAKQVLEARGEVTKMTEAITGTSTAYDQQRINLDNLATDLTKAGTATSAFFRSLGQSQDGFFRQAIQGYSSFLKQLTGKNTELKAFFSTFFDTLKGGELPVFGLFRGLKSANAQREANVAAGQSQARIKGVVSSAKTSVDGETGDLVKAYQKRGELLPDAQRKAASAVAKQRDEDFVQARADHNKLRKEYENATANQKKGFKARFDASKQAVLFAEIARKQAMSNESRANKAEADQKKALASALGEGPTNKAKASGNKAANDAKRVQEETYKVLLKAQEDYQSAAQKLIDEHGKERLELLKNDQEAYILEKARLDKEEVEVERRKMEVLLQIARSTKTKRNAAGTLEVVADTSVTLAKDVPELNQVYTDRQKQIDERATTEIAQVRLDARIKMLGLERRYNELELAENEKKWVALIKNESDSARKAALKKLQNQETERILLGQAINQNRDGEAAADAFINQDRFERQLKDQNVKYVDIELERQKAILKSRIFFQTKLKQLLIGQGESENAVLISQTQALIDGLNKQLNGLNAAPKNRDIFDLLGISKSFKDETEREQFLSAVRSIGDSIQSATQYIIEAAESRIAILNEQITNREDQLKTELERRKEGQANNADLLKAELNDLKAQKAEEEKIRRQALKTQQTLDLLSTASTNATTVANLISATVKAFQATAGIPFVGVALAVASVAAIFAAIASFKAKASAITRLKAGGVIDRNGKTHEQGGHRIEGTNIEVERGEWVVNAKSSEIYNEELDAINKNDPKKAFMALVKKYGFGLPTPLMANHERIRETSHTQTNTITRLDKVEDLLSKIYEQVGKPTKQLIGMADGRVLEIEGGKTKIIDYGKRS